MARAFVCEGKLWFLGLFLRLSEVQNFTHSKDHMLLWSQDPSKCCSVISYFLSCPFLVLPFWHGAYTLGLASLDPLLSLHTTHLPLCAAPASAA